MLTGTESVCFSFQFTAVNLPSRIDNIIHKVLITTEPSYLYKLFSVQPPRNTRSSSSVTFSRPSSSSLKITNRSFRFASPHLWNQLPVSFRQSTNQSPSHSPYFTHGSSCTSSSFSPSLTPSLFTDFWYLTAGLPSWTQTAFQTVMLISLFYFLIIVSF